MARNISQIHTLVEYLVRKERGVFISPQQIDNMLNMGQLDVFNAYHEEFKKTSVLNVALTPFKKMLDFSLTTSVGGLVTIPSDFEFILNGYTIVYSNERGAERKRITPLDEDELINALASQLRPISTSRPAMIQGGSKFVLYPQVPQAGRINYVSTPVAPVYAYTQVGRVITYDPANSTQLQWRDSYINQVILSGLAYIGINMNENDIASFGENKAQEVAVP